MKSINLNTLASAKQIVDKLLEDQSEPQVGQKLGPNYFWVSTTVGGKQQVVVGEAGAHTATLEIIDPKFVGDKWVDDLVKVKITNGYFSSVADKNGKFHYTPAIGTIVYVSYAEAVKTNKEPDEPVGMSFQEFSKQYPLLGKAALHMTNSGTDWLNTAKQIKVLTAEDKSKLQKVEDWLVKNGKRILPEFIKTSGVDLKAYLYELGEKDNDWQIASVFEGLVEYAVNDATDVLLSKDPDGVLVNDVLNNIFDGDYSFNS